MKTIFMNGLVTGKKDVEYNIMLKLVIYIQETFNERKTKILDEFHTFGPIKHTKSRKGGT